MFIFYSQSDPRDFHEMKMPDGQTVLRVPPHYAQLAAALGLNSQMEPVVGAAAAGTVNSTLSGSCVITPTDFENLIELHRKQHQSPHRHLGGEQIGETAEHRCTRTELPAPSTPAPAMCAPAWEHYPKSSSSSPPPLPPTHQQLHHSPLEYHQRQQSMSPAMASMLPPPSVDINNMEINENKLHSQNIIDTMDVDVDGDVDDDEEQQTSSSPPSRPHQSTPSPSTPPSTPSLHQPSSHSIISDEIVVGGSTIEVGGNDDNVIAGNVGELDCDGKTTMVIPYDNSYTSSPPQQPSNLASQTTLAVGKKNCNSSASYSFGEGLKENRIYEQNQNNQNLLNQNCDPNAAHHQQQQQQQQAYMHSMHHHHSHHLNVQQIDENMWRPW